VKRTGIEAEGQHYRVSKRGERLSIQNKQSRATVTADIGEDGSHQIVKAQGLESVDVERWERLGQHDARSLSRHTSASNTVEDEDMERD
jgi:hypothetical protein